REAVTRLGVDAAPLLDAAARTGRLGEEPGIPAELRRLFITALEIPPERHLEVQAAFQRHVDNSVSKTVNLPKSATDADVAGIFRRAWALGLKGVTVYRYGSKPGQVLELGAGEDALHLDHASACDPTECRV
ncbi:MAG TPA: hypothetical protein VFQ38_23835, partial [Longimicrobiales bacterium]|nr:hypothetical protein [Longimicrobiales bacterium]